MRISPGQHYLKVPTGLKDNLEYRAAVLQASHNDLSVQKRLRAMCAEDVVFFISTFGWQTNPKKTGLDAIYPFIPWEKQIDVLLARPETHVGQDFDRGVVWSYENRKSGVCQKSRYEGMSWLYCFFELWLCLHQENITCLNLSRDEEAVDDGTTQSLFGKMRWILEALPEWYRGAIGGTKNSKCPIIDTKLSIEFKRNGNFILGESSTKKSSVGGRATFMLNDEFQLNDNGAVVRQRTAGTCDCRWFVGTHAGLDTEFYRLTLTPEFCQVGVHWTSNPWKNHGMYSYNEETQQHTFYDQQFSVVDKPWGKVPFGYNFRESARPLNAYRPGIRSPWYDNEAEVEIGNERAVAMELDMDVRGATDKLFNEAMIERLRRTVTRNPSFEGRLFFNHWTGVTTSFEECDNGPLKFWFTPRSKNEVPAGPWVFGIDISRGRGATPSCISIMHAITGERMAEFVSADWEPKEFAQLVLALGKLFVDIEKQPAFLVWERQGPATNFADEIDHHDYPGSKFYYQREVLPSGQIIQDKIPGFFPRKDSTKKILESYQTALASGHCTNYCAIALKECLDFSFTEEGKLKQPGNRKANDPSGAGENHADRAISDALAWRGVVELGKYAGLIKWIKPELPYNSMQARRERRNNKRFAAKYW